MWRSWDIYGVYQEWGNGKNISKKEVTGRTYPRGILFDIMALGVGAYLGESAYFRKYTSP